jgi:transposase
MGAIGGKALHGIGKTQGGWTSRIHIVVDKKGRPLKIAVKEGNRNDNIYAKALLIGKLAKWVIADKAYDTNEIREFLKKRGEKAVIPKQSRYGHLAQQTYNKSLYKKRCLIEIFIQRLKSWRGIATRYAKTNAMYTGSIVLVNIIIWLIY